MRIIKDVKQDEVWNHWKTVESFTTDDFRSDIRNPLPSDTKWYLALIEKADIKNLHIISSDDWNEISGGTFLVGGVVKNLDKIFVNEDTLRISNDIIAKVDFLKSGGLFDTRFILVTNDVRGFFTIIEGNRRTVALLLVDLLIDKKIYLGISNNMKFYHWARYTYGG